MVLPRAPCGFSTIFILAINRNKQDYFLSAHNGSLRLEVNSFDYCLPWYLSVLAKTPGKTNKKWILVTYTKSTLNLNSHDIWVCSAVIFASWTFRLKWYNNNKKKKVSWLPWLFPQHHWSTNWITELVNKDKWQMRECIVLKTLWACWARPKMPAVSF